MKTMTVVADSSPLISLSAIDSLDLLKSLFETIRFSCGSALRREIFVQFWMNPYVRKASEVPAVKGGDGCVLARNHGGVNVRVAEVYILLIVFCYCQGDDLAV